MKIFRMENPWGDETPKKGRPNQNNGFQFKKPSMGNGGGLQVDPSTLILGGVGILLLVWILSGFYQINPDEEGLVLRFGRLARTSEAGWHYHLPYPVEQVIKPKVTQTNQIVIGMGNTEESLMLTGDRNIVDVTVIVQWHIKNAQNFLFNIRDPEKTIKAVTESAIRDIIGQMPIDLTFAEGRAEIQDKAKELVQSILDSYGAGVQVTEVNLKDVNPPQPVIESFREVDRAYSDQERMFNEAEAYRNDVVPQARGEAAKIIQDSEAYKQSAVATANGDTKRFLAVLKEYKKAPDVTKQRLYLETVEDVLTKSNKVLIDAKAGQNILPHMALPSVKGN